MRRLHTDLLGPFAKPWTIAHKIRSIDTSESHSYPLMPMRPLFIALILACTLGKPDMLLAQSLADDRAAIQAVLQRQTEQWNQGNLEGFMQGYWQSDSLSFVGSRGITQGWKNTLANYQQHYPDAASRGTLRFEIVRVEMLSREAAFVIGKFFLARPEKGDAKGHFTLLWRKIKGNWVITVDHSS